MCLFLSPTLEFPAPTGPPPHSPSRVPGLKPSLLLFTAGCVCKHACVRVCTVPQWGFLGCCLDCPQLSFSTALPHTHSCVSVFSQVWITRTSTHTPRHQPYLFRVRKPHSPDLFTLSHTCTQGTDRDIPASLAKLSTFHQSTRVPYPWANGRRHPTGLVDAIITYSKVGPLLYPLVCPQVPGTVLGNL